MAEKNDVVKSLSVLFYDGEQEINIGAVEIYPSLDLKTFQSILSQKIGISPNQMSIYLVDRKNPKFSHHSRPKVLITGRVSFDRIYREQDCAILVVLKRSRRDRRRRARRVPDAINYSPPAPGKVILLRRNQQQQQEKIRCDIVSDYFLGERFRKLELERGNYLAMISGHFPDFGGDDDDDDDLNNNVGGFERPGTMVMCEECANGEFHCCVNDAVTVGFRSPAGPIGRRRFK